MNFYAEQVHDIVSTTVSAFIKGDGTLANVIEEKETQIVEHPSGILSKLQLPFTLLLFKSLCVSVYKFFFSIKYASIDLSETNIFMILMTYFKYRTTSRRAN